MAVVNSTPPGRARKFCLLAVRILVCLVAAALIAMDVAVQHLPLLTAIGIILGIEQYSIATSILKKGAALRHFLSDDH